MFTKEECKNLIKDLNIISYTDVRTNVCKTKINLELMESILFYTKNCRDRLSERIYWILNDIEDYPFCLECGKQFKPNFYGLKTSYSGINFCSPKCVFNNDQIREKIEQTCLQTLGVKNPSQSEKIKQKKIDTCLKNHGVKNPWQIKHIREKAEQTCLKRYNAKFPFQSPIIKQKIKNSYNWEQRQEKTKQTCLKNYGVEYSLQSPVIRDKGKQTFLKNWNEEHPMKNKQFFTYHKTTSYKHKLLVLPSGNEITYQGYENIAILTLLKRGYSEHEIIIDNNFIPSFNYQFENKIKTYYPDIFIPSKNLIIEVKSNYTYNNFLAINLAKQQACIDTGYNFEFWICSKTEVLEIKKGSRSSLLIRF
jgi:hypothetical protein